MSLRTLLFHVADDPHLEAHAARAAELARAFDARLVGLSCHRPAPWPRDGAVAFLEGDPLTVQMRAEEDAALAHEATFLHRCGVDGLRAFEAVRDDTAPVAALCERALGADLVLMPQAEPGRPAYVERRALLDTVLAQCARPVLVLPHAAYVAPLGGPMLVAWDGSAGAARAAAGALPLLARASVVHLLQLSPTVDDDAECRPGLERAAAWLSDHGLDVRPRVAAAAPSVGAALLAAAAEVEASLLVMGAWGHRRMVERLLGGATRAVVDGATVPVLFAH